MACLCELEENSKIFRDNTKSAETYDYGFEDENDIIEDLDCSEEEEENVSTTEPVICKLFVDGNEADYEICEDEDELLERVWQLSKPPKIPRHTCVVPARRIQVMEERLSSTINAMPTLSDAMRDGGMKNGKRIKITNTDVEYVKVSSSDDRKRGSCQGRSINIVPSCARTLDELF